MARVLMLIRELEDAERVRYQFGWSESALGLLQLDKATGDVHEMRAFGGESSQELFFSAAARVRDFWRAAHFPEHATQELA